MRKLLAISIATLSLNAFAQKSMVTLSGYETGDVQDRSLDLSHSNGGAPNASTNNIALNYAYAFTDSLQVGLNFKNYSHEQSGDQVNADRSSTTYGLQAIYNFAHKLTDTCYLALHYDMKKFKESDDVKNDADKVNTWTVEFGHRFNIGTVWGLNFNYSPSANLAFQKTTADQGDDSSHTNFTLNFVKFDVLF